MARKKRFRTSALHSAELFQELSVIYFGSQRGVLLTCVQCQHTGVARASPGEDQHLLPSARLEVNAEVMAAASCVSSPSSDQAK